MNRWLALCLAGAAVTAAYHPALPAALAQEAPALVEKGQACLKKGDWTAARDAFLAAVKKDGKSLEARRGAAEALLGLGASDDAVEQANAGLDLCENRDAGLWLLVSRGWLQKAQSLPAEKTDEIGSAFADAKAKAAQALKLDPNLNLARVVFSTASRLSGDSVQAAEVLEAGLANFPADFDLQFEMGMVQLKKTDYDAALKAFTAAAAADPKSGDALYQKAMALAYLKRPEECYADLVRSAVLDPSSTRALQLIAKWQVKSPQKAVEYYRAILKEAPGHAWAHAYLAFGLAKLKDEAGAMAESKAALAKDPGNPVFMDWNGQVLDELKKGPEALGWYRKAVQKDPNLRHAWDRLSVEACGPPPYSTAKPDDRRELIDFLTKLRPDDAVLWNDAGLVFRDVIHDYKRSLECYLMAAKLSPKDQGILNDTGLIYLYHGENIGVDPKLGLPYFLRCLALVKEDGQSPEMGYRDTLQNLSRYYSKVEKNPEKCLEYATERNDPEFLATLPKELAGISPEAATAKAWAEKELKR